MKVLGCITVFNQRDIQNLITLQQLAGKDVDLGVDLWEDLLRQAEYKKARKNEYLQKEGSPVNYMFFVVSGIAREHLVFVDGRDVNATFHEGPALVGNAFSYRAELDASYSISMVTPGFYYRIESNIIIEKITQHPQGERWLNAMLARSYTKLQRRMLLLLHKNAEERLLEFAEAHPNLIKQVPDYHIATYLSITPVTMHRAKRKLRARREREQLTEIEESDMRCVAV